MKDYFTKQYSIYLIRWLVSALVMLPVMIFLMSKTKEPITVPFIPFLAMATFIVFIFDYKILEYIEALY